MPPPPRDPAQLQSVVSMVPMVLMYLAMLADVALSIFANLRILKAQLMALRSFGIDPRSTPAHRKYQVHTCRAHMHMHTALACTLHMHTALACALHMPDQAPTFQAGALRLAPPPPPHTHTPHTHTRHAHAHAARVCVRCGAHPVCHRAMPQMFVRLALYTLLYVLLEMVIHLTFTGRKDESFALFVLLHQLIELFIAVGIGYTFRAQPFNVHFQQIQQVAS